MHGQIILLNNGQTDVNEIRLLKRYAFFLTAFVTIFVPEKRIFFFKTLLFFQK